MLKNKTANIRDALRAAANKGCLEAVRFFVEEGVDKDGTDKEAQTPLMLAYQNNHLAIVQFLEEYKTDESKTDMSLKNETADTRDALRAAADKGCLGAVRFLVEEEVSQDDADMEGRTPLMLAIQSGHVAVARYLVESMQVGKTIQDDSWGSAALMFAATKGDLVMMQWLLEQGADKEIVDNVHHKTLLMTAAENGHLAVVQWLSEQEGTNKEMVDDEGYTALMHAAESGHLAVVQWLSEQEGANKEVVDVEGYTTLILAARSGHLAVIEWLLEQGADVNKATIRGFTALHWACNLCHFEVVTCLMNWGASLTARISSGYFVNLLPIDFVDNQAIKQLIRDEETRRRDHGYKRAVIPNPTDAERKRARIERGEEEDETEGQGQAVASVEAEEDDGENDDSGSDIEYY